MINNLASAIYTQLQGGTALTALLSGTTAIYHMAAPEDTSLPYVIFNLQGGGDENMTANRTKDLVVFVRAYCTGGTGAAQAGSIDAQIDARLHNQTLSVSGWTNFWLRRETDLTAVQNAPSGQQIFMAGGMYRVRLDQT